MWLQTPVTYTFSSAIGPYATIFQVWESGALPTVNGKDQAEVPLWILAFGSIAIVIGLWTYGYNIIINLGNRLTLHSPSRGFSMELGAAITVIIATRYGKSMLIPQSRRNKDVAKLVTDIYVS